MQVDNNKYDHSDPLTYIEFNLLCFQSSCMLRSKEDCGMFGWPIRLPEQKIGWSDLDEINKWDFANLLITCLFEFRNSSDLEIFYSSNKGLRTFRVIWP